MAWLFSSTSSTTRANAKRWLAGRRVETTDPGQIKLMPTCQTSLKSENDGETALSVKIKSDGDASEQNLWLYETGRFTGRYEGYARLTDADGDGPTVAGQGAHSATGAWMSEPRLDHR